jgi:elongation factor G
VVKNIGIDKLLDGIVDYAPSPLDVPPVVATNKKNSETIDIKATDSFFSAQVFKTMADPYVGKLTLFRVYSGSLSSDSSTYNASKDATERIGQIFVMNGKEQIAVHSVNAGDIAAVAKVQVTGTGDTLCDKDNAVVFPAIEFPESTLFMAVQPKAKGDEDKIGSGLARLAEEDPTFRSEKNVETGQTLIYGMGELHLEIILNKLMKKFGVDVELITPKIPYRETIKGKTQVEGKHKKQSGGRGQYGHVFLELEPLPSGQQFEFVDKIFGGAVPKQYIPAVEKGVVETMQQGVLAGYPVVDVKVTLYDGSYHSVDSSEMAFKIAASMAFKKGMMEAKPVLLEPIMKVTVTVPEEFMGDIMGDLNKKRGRILGMEPVGNKQVITAEAPLAEMFKYAIDLCTNIPPWLA